MTIQHNFRSLFANFRLFAGDIKLAHSVFALPFAAAAILFANPIMPSIDEGLYLVLCMVSARSFAMGMNRYLDRNIDKKNPRTAGRKIPSGSMTSGSSLAWSLAAGLLFIICATQLNSLSGFLSVPVLFILAGYPLMKRLTWLTHWYLGGCLGLAPVAVSIALTGGAEAPVVLIGFAVMFWTAGFDILYSLQDRRFDVENQLRSVPAQFGPWKSVLISRGCFIVMIVLLTAVGHISSVGALYDLAVISVALILAYEQWLVRDVRHLGYSERINAAFFNVNAWVSVFFYILVQADFLVS